MDRRQFLSAAAGGLASLAHVAGASERPNIILFLTDDLGYGDLGCYGVRDIHTPNIDRLAKEGVRFTQCYSNGPVCTPTRAGLMTGRYQQRAGLEWALGPGQKGRGLTSEHVTVATRLKDAGYRTALCGKWHLGYEPENGPNRHGFEEFYGILSGNVDHYSHREINGEPDLYENLRPVEEAGYLTELIAARAEKYVDRNAASPFFLYVAFNAVHWPFQAPGRPNDIRTRATWFDGTRADYVQMVESVDQAVGKVLAAVDRQNQKRNTLVIFTNDNGGERLSSNIPWFHHKATLWEGGIRVPAVVRWPARLSAGRDTQQVAISMDFAATILSAAGISPPVSPALDGIDLLPILENRRPEVERELFWRIDRIDRKQKAVRRGDWKYIRDGAGIEMLFNLAGDPAEKLDLAYQHPKRRDELRKAVADWEAELAKNPPPFVIK